MNVLIETPCEKVPDIQYNFYYSNSLLQTKNVRKSTVRVIFEQILVITLDQFGFFE